MAQSGDRTGSRLSLLVVTEGGTSTIALPEKGEVVVGRGDDCEIRVNDPQLSRRHAAMTLGATMTLRDLGSLNGTRVGERRVAPEEPVRIALGDTITIGTVVLTLQSTATTSRPRRVWAHGYFEARIEEECARADRSGQSFAVMRLRVIKGGRAEEVVNLLGECLRPSDIVGIYAPSELELLLVDIGAEDSEAIANRIRDRMADEQVITEVGVALYKRDGRTPEALMAHAGGFASEEDRSSNDSSTKPLRVGAMQRLQPLVERVASGVINVLVVGETGVGKEVMARTIHEASPRAGARLVAINCAALPEALLESELFGHERGAFTGAVQAKVGLLEAAEGGTVFLDEAGEMPLALQAKLLRVLDQREVWRVGAVTPRRIDVRFIAATNRDLAGEIARGRFRQDLYFRLNGITLAIPPLRERVEEIEPLARSFVTNACHQMGRAREPQIAPSALALLLRYEWPGNVRELRNVIERAVLLTTDDEIRVEHLPAEKMGPILPARPASPPATLHVAIAPRDTAFSDGEEITRVMIADRVTPRASPPASERERIIEVLQTCAGNQTQAAKLLGISRGTLIARLKEYELPRPRKR